MNTLISIAAASAAGLTAPFAFRTVARALAPAVAILLTAPALGLYLVSFDLYSGLPSQRGFSPTHVLLSILWLVPLVLMLVVPARVLGERAGPIRLFLLYYGVALALSMFSATEVETVVAALTSIAAIGAMTLFASRRPTADLMLMMTSAVLLWCLVALAAEITVALGVLDLRSSPPLVPGVRRALAFSLHQNTLGAAAGCLMLLGWYCLRDLSTRQHAARLGRGAVSVGLVTLLMAGTRTVFVAVAASVLVGVVFSGRTRPWTRIALVLAIAGTSLFMLAGGTPDSEVIAARPGIDATNTVTLRQEIWDTSVELIQERWPTGYGLAATKTVLADKVEVEVGTEGITHAHSLVLQLLLDTGALGLLLVVVAFGRSITVCYRRGGRSPALIALLVFPLTAGVAESTLGIRQPYLATLIFFAVVATFGRTSPMPEGADQVARPALERRYVAT